MKCYEIERIIVNNGSVDIEDIKKYIERTEKKTVFTDKKRDTIIIEDNDSFLKIKRDDIIHIKNGVIRKMSNEEFDVFKNKYTILNRKRDISNEYVDLSKNYNYTYYNGELNGFLVDYMSKNKDIRLSIDNGTRLVTTKDEEPNVVSLMNGFIIEKDNKLSSLNCGDFNLNYIKTEDYNKLKLNLNTCARKHKVLQFKDRSFISEVRKSLDCKYDLFITENADKIIIEYEQDYNNDELIGVEHVYLNDFLLIYKNFKDESVCIQTLTGNPIKVGYKNIGNNYYTSPYGDTVMYVKLNDKIEKNILKNTMSIMFPNSKVEIKYDSLSKNIPSEITIGDKNINKIYYGDFIIIEDDDFYVLSSEAFNNTFIDLSKEK